LDTNVLVYLYDQTDAGKQAQAARVVRAIRESGTGAVSTQVLSEFFHIVTHRLRPRLSLETAMVELENHADVWNVLNLTADVILSAARATKQYQMNFWDAQLWAVAKSNGVTTIVSEDFNSGATLGGIRFRNPFAPGFQWP
jgi:predicted nucleic acid-binding protein